MKVLVSLRNNEKTQVPEIPPWGSLSISPTKYLISSVILPRQIGEHPDQVFGQCFKKLKNLLVSQGFGGEGVLDVLWHAAFVLCCSVMCCFVLVCVVMQQHQQQQQQQKQHQYQQHHYQQQQQQQ